jgi:hypothetical protein
VEERKTGRESKRESEREGGGSATQMGSLGPASSAWVSVQQRIPNLLARYPCAKWRGTPSRDRRCAWHATCDFQDQREKEQAAPRRVALTESEERSRSGGEQWKREANDGWEIQKGSKVRDPQSGGTWGQFSSLGSREGRTRRARE